MMPSNCLNDDGQFYRASYCRPVLRHCFATAACLCLLLVGCKRPPTVEQKADDPVPVGRAQVQNPDLPGRPAREVQTPEQQAFWDYLEAFNRLPDQPNEMQRQIFATKGEAKAFQFISTSPKSVFSDVAGMKAHRSRFQQRYPWVKRLLEKEHFSLEVDEVLFSGTTAEILEKHYQKVDWSKGDYYQRKGNRTVFAHHWLESLLALDYIVACGSEQDRVDAFVLLDQMLCTVAVIGPDRVSRAAELEIPVATDIIMPIANTLPEHCPERVVSYVGLLLKTSEAPAFYLNCMKWSLRVKEFAKWPDITRLHQVFVGNHCVQQGLPHYTIYWYHLREGVRPENGSSAVAVQVLFTVLYGKQDGPKEHKKYLALLNAAYPPKP